MKPDFILILNTSNLQEVGKNGQDPFKGKEEIVFRSSFGEVLQVNKREGKFDIGPVADAKAKEMILDSGKLDRRFENYKCIPNEDGILELVPVGDTGRGTLPTKIRHQIVTLDSKETFLVTEKDEEAFLWKRQTPLRWAPVESRNSNFRLFVFSGLVLAILIFWLWDTVKFRRATVES